MKKGLSKNSEEKDKRKNLFDDLINLPYNKSRENVESKIELAMNSEHLTQEQKNYFKECHKTINKWCAAYKKLRETLG